MTLFLVRVLEREPVLQMRQRAGLLSFAGIWAIAFFAQDLPLTFGTLVALSCITLAGASLDVSRTTQTEASWSVATAPLSAAERSAAMRRAVHLRSTLFILPLLGVWAAYDEGPAAAAVHLLGVGSASYFLVACGLAVRPREPLSTPLSTASGLGALFASLPFAFAGVILWAPFAVAAAMPAVVALVVAAWGASILCGFATLLELFASRRLESI